MDGALRKYPRSLFLLEVATSLLFSLDYVFRLWTCREKSRFSHLGPLSASLRWALSRDSLLSAISCVPVFVDGSAAARTGRWHDAVLTALHLTPVLLLTRTALWREAVRTARRVVFVNRCLPIATAPGTPAGLYSALALTRDCRVTRAPASVQANPLHKPCFGVADHPPLCLDALRGLRA